MSPVPKNGLLFGLASVFALIAVMFVPLPGLNVLIGYALVAGLAGYGGYLAAKQSGAAPGQGVRRGATAGAIAGAVNMIVLSLIFGLLLTFIPSIPGFREGFNNALEQARQQDPDQADALTSGVLGLGGAIIGFCIGVVNLIVTTIAGLVGGALWKGGPLPLGNTSVPYVASGSALPPAYSSAPPPYTSAPPAYPSNPAPAATGPTTRLDEPAPDQETNARIYPDDAQR